MKIHEYQAKELFRKAGVAVLRGKVAATADEAAAAYAELGGDLAVVKAQIHAGGRGKGTIKEKPEQRGVQLVRSADEAKKASGNILGNTLVTIQTGAEGKTVNRVFVEEGCQIARELYLGIVLDRAAGFYFRTTALIASWTTGQAGVKGLAVSKWPAAGTMISLASSPARRAASTYCSTSGCGT